MFVVFVQIGGRGVGTAPLNADVGSASNGQVAPLRELLFKLGGGGLALTL